MLTSLRMKDPFSAIFSYLSKMALKKKKKILYIFWLSNRYWLLACSHHYFFTTWMGNFHLIPLPLNWSCVLLQNNESIINKTIHDITILFCFFSDKERNCLIVITYIRLRWHYHKSLDAHLQPQSIAAYCEESFHNIPHFNCPLYMELHYLVSYPTHNL